MFKIFQTDKSLHCDRKSKLPNRHYRISKVKTISGLQDNVAGAQVNKKKKFKVCTFKVYDIRDLYDFILIQNKLD